MTESTSKQILDKWAIKTISKDAIYELNGNVMVNSKKYHLYDKDGYNENYVLWIAPKDCIRIEFEDSKENNERHISEVVSACKSLEIDYCVTSHGGKSDYINIFNIKGMPLNEDNIIAKMLFIDMIIPAVIKSKLDRTNLGWTFSPVIGHPHWKPQYNGAKHDILYGKSPLEHENKYPSAFLKKIDSAKKRIKKNVTNNSDLPRWVEDFLLKYCLNNKLPVGSRHVTIEKNLAAYIIFRKDKEEMKSKWREIQDMQTDGLKGWELAILNGSYTEVSIGELVNYIKENKIPYDVPNIENMDVMSGDKIKEAIGSFDNYFQMADKFLKIQPLYFDNAKIWWLWNFKESCWKMIDEIDLLNIVDEQLQSTKTILPQQRTMILDVLRRRSRLNKPSDVKNTWVQFKNEIVDIKTGERFKSSSKYFSHNAIPWKLGNDTKTPTIDKFFKEWVGEKYVQLLYEILAFSILPDYPIHRVFCFLGSGANGKSTYLQLVENFVGFKNVCSTELQILMNSRFESSKLYKKLICMMGETSFAMLEKTDTFKRLTGGDTIGFEFKNKGGFDEKNYAKILISTNSLPPTSDKTEGFYRRWVIIDFPNVFSQSFNILKQIPKEEYENLALKCVGLLKGILLKGEFTNEGDVIERRRKYEEKSNPITTFIDECCDKDMSEDIGFTEFHHKFIEYLKKKNQRILSSKAIGMALGEEGYERRTKGIFTDDGLKTTMKVVVGLRWKNEETME